MQDTMIGKDDRRQGSRYKKLSRYIYIQRCRGNAGDKTPCKVLDKPKFGSYRRVHNLCIVYALIRAIPSIDYCFHIDVGQHGCSSLRMRG